MKFVRIVHKGVIINMFLLLVLPIMAMQEKVFSPISQLPPEVMTIIFKQLSIRDLKKCVRMCKNWAHIVCDCAPYVQQKMSRNFFYAIEQALIDEVSLLVGECADVNQQFEQGDTPLTLAVCHNKTTDIVKLLVENGADVRRTNQLRYTPLWCAKKRECLCRKQEENFEHVSEMVRYLSEKSSCGCICF